jgi:hypothetical protein
MHKAHTQEITPLEVIKMEPKLARFATKNPGFEQYQIQLHRALANPEVMEELRMAAKARISEAGMLKAARTSGKKEVAVRLLKRGRPLDEIAEDTGLSFGEIQSLQEKLY